MDALITFVLGAWSCLAVISPSASFFKSPFLNQSHDLLALTCSVGRHIWPWRGLVFHFSIFSVSSFSSSVCGVPHFLSYLFKFYCFFAVVPWCFERNRPTPSLLWEHTPPGHSIYNPRKVVESRIGQHQLVDEKYHKQLSVYGYLFFFRFFLFLSMASSSALL